MGRNKIKQAEIKKEVNYVNPFEKGIGYDAVLDSIPSGVSIENHFKSKLSKEQIEWLKSDLKHYTESKNYKLKQK